MRGKIIMELIIHRGTNQIGGCATEIRTDTTRIFIDLGAELGDEVSMPLSIEGLSIGKKDCDAIFFTHYHGDHIGLIGTVLQGIPMYIGKVSKGIMLIRNSIANEYNSYMLNELSTYKAPHPVSIGNITITPILVDHSAFDAHMFLMEADGKKILHTGDFRAHGFRGKGLLPALERYVGKVDALICEGTTLRDSNSRSVSENELQKEIGKVLRENKYVFFLCPLSNIDRIASVCSVVPQGKYCLCDSLQYEILEYVREVAGNKSNLYKFNKMLYHRKSLDEKMLKQGFCMFVRGGNPTHRKLMENYLPKGGIIIYSMWEGYKKQKSMHEFLDGFPCIDLHTSGHADSNTLRTVIDTVSPDTVIPIHTTSPASFENLISNRRLVLPTDGEIIRI